jgi:flagellar motor switch protein FliN/FliY
MPADLQSILQIEVPVIVQIGGRRMTADEVMSLGPGAIIELTKHADDPLDVLVNNKPIGHGTAVKVGENFGVRITGLGKLADRIKAMGEGSAKVAAMEEVTEGDESSH